MPCWNLRSSSVYCQSWVLCMWLCWKSTPFIQAWLLRGVGMHGAAICRLLRPELIKSMLTNVYLIFRSMSQVPSCLYNRILSVAALNLSVLETLWAPVQWSRNMPSHQATAKQSSSCLFLHNKRDCPQNSNNYTEVILSNILSLNTCLLHRGIVNSSLSLNWFTFTLQNYEE